MIQIKPLLPIDPALDAYAKALGALENFSGQGLLIEFVGESGSGKSTIVRKHKELHDHTHLITCTSTMGIKDLMQKLAGQVGTHLSGNTFQFQDQLTTALKDKAEHTFILDECEYLSKNNIDKLEIIRQIWDETSNTFIFCGTYKLRKILVGNSNDPESEYSQLYRRMKKVKVGVVGQEEFYRYLDFIEKRYVVSFKKDARNLLYGYCADTKHGGLGTCIEILKTTFNRIRPEWISISVHLAYSEDTMNYFPDSFRLRDPDDDLSCYSANAVHIDKEEIERLKPVEISSSLIRSVSKYQIVI